MQITDISEAKARLSALVERVLAGEDVIIGKAGRPLEIRLGEKQDPLRYRSLELSLSLCSRSGGLMPE